MMDFSKGAGQSTSADVLPKGLIVWAWLSVRGVKVNSSTGTKYVDVELTIDDNQPFARRKLWDKIADPYHQANSENWRQQGLVAITRILEAGRGAGPNNAAGYQISDFQQLDGLKVAIKVGVEPGSDGFDDKNRVADWLTPNPASQSGHKGYQKLMAGDHGVTSPQQQAQQPSNGFGNAGGGQPAQQQAGGFGNGGAAAQQPTGQGGGFGGQQAQPPAEQAQQPTGDASGWNSGNGSPATQQQPGWLAQAQQQAPDDDVPF